MNASRRAGNDDSESRTVGGVASAVANAARAVSEAVGSNRGLNNTRTEPYPDGFIGPRQQDPNADISRQLPILRPPITTRTEPYPDGFIGPRQQDPNADITRQFPFLRPPIIEGEARDRLIEMSEYPSHSDAWSYVPERLEAERLEAERLQAEADARRMASAQEILDRHYGVSESGRRINLTGVGTPTQNSAGLDPLSNIRDTAAGEMARTRPYFNRNPDQPNYVAATAAGEAPDLFLNEYMLEAMLYLNNRFGDLSINAIAGLNHFGGEDDEHVRGLAFDMARIPGHSANNSRDVFDYLHYRGFITQRNRADYLPDEEQYAGPGYANFLSNSLHISIFGRNHPDDVQN
ncbi:MAG: hypothetical protein FWC91_12995 [Defluviitaleaceae bacterium]|nr:hypothetical protein [Defluviitaleaceae bacterium]